MTEFGHVPVMLTEVMEWLKPESGGPIWDLTLGAGGHLGEFLSRAPTGTQGFGLDGDPSALVRAAHVPATLVHGDMADLATIAAEWPTPMAVLLDLGLSSPQVDDPARGFSYHKDGPLDMRMNTTVGRTASDWLDDIPEAELSAIIRELGDERLSGRIARVIKERCPIETTAELRDAILAAVGRHRTPHIHPARRTFQAIRIAVNREFDKLEAGIRVATDRLAIGGRLAVISFHSGEDRVVKNLFRELSLVPGITTLTRKPLLATDAEAEGNPRARSARLRVLLRQDPNAPKPPRVRRPKPRRGKGKRRQG